MREVNDSDGAAEGGIGHDSGGGFCSVCGAPWPCARARRDLRRPADPQTPPLAFGFLRLPTDPQVAEERKAAMQALATARGWQLRTFTFAATGNPLTAAGRLLDACQSSHPVAIIMGSPEDMSGQLEEQIQREARVPILVAATESASVRRLA